MDINIEPHGSGVMVSVSSPLSSLDYKNRGRICFSGFEEEKKKILQVMAEESGFKVSATVTSGMIFLVVGKRPGPQKIKKARKLKITIIDEEEFIRITSTAGVTIDSAQRKILALKEGKTHAGDARDTQNVGICPHCKNLIIPAPQKIRKCPYCGEMVIPLGRDLVHGNGKPGMMNIEDYIRHIENKNISLGTEISMLQDEVDYLREKLEKKQGRIRGKGI